MLAFEMCATLFFQNTYMPCFALGTVKAVYLWLRLVIDILFLFHIADIFFLCHIADQVQLLCLIRTAFPDFLAFYVKLFNKFRRDMFTWMNIWFLNHTWRLCKHVYTAFLHLSLLTNLSLLQNTKFCSCLVITEGSEIESDSKILLAGVCI